MIVNLSTFNNEHYSPGRSYLQQLLWYFVNCIFFINPLNPFSGIKVMLLKAFGAWVGKNVLIKPAVNIKYPWHLSIGDNVWIGEKVWIDNLTTTTIGSNVCISQGAMLLTGNHDYKSPSFDLITKGIVLEDGVWIGAQSVVCPGVRCLSHAVLSVNSVANKELAAYGIYQGNPAVFIRNRKLMKGSISN